MPDPDAPKQKKAKKEEDIGEMWVKFWNMDPENYIWGIDPNEKPPEVRTCEIRNLLLNQF